MATSDVHGHRVPTGSDFAARKSLTDLSLSIMGGPKSVGSLAAANLYVTDVTAALSAAGLPPISADNPLYVSRSDLGGAFYRHDGSAWVAVLGYDSGWVDLWTSERSSCVRASSTAPCGSAPPSPRPDQGGRARTSCPPGCAQRGLARISMR